MFVVVNHFDLKRWTRETLRRVPNVLVPLIEWVWSPANLQQEEAHLVLVKLCSPGLHPSTSSPSVLSRDWRIELTWKHRSIGAFCIFSMVCKYVSPDFWIWYPHRGVVTDTAAERRPAVLQCCSVLKYELQQSNPVILIQVRHSEWSLKCEAIKCSVAGRR